ncbi:MAG: DNA/RNA nuclease SfsA [Deltaproteobacteria bacterium]
MTVSIPMPGPLQPGRYLQRPNQFTLRVRLDLTGEIVLAHLPDPGRLVDLLVENARIWLQQVNDPSRKTQWTAIVAQDVESNVLVSVDTRLPNELVAAAIAADELEEIDGWTLVKREATIGRSRFDFLLETVSGEQMALEVKGVTLVKQGIAMFPDAPSDRAVKHLRELADIAQQPGWGATALFLVQRIDAAKVMAARHIDRDFADALADAARAGVRLVARRCQLTLEEMALGNSIPVDPALHRH